MMKTFQQILLMEGGVAGVMNHPYHIAENGSDLIEIFKKTVYSITDGHATLKIDGINVSVRVVDDVFVMDRGSQKELDRRGLKTKEDFHKRFPSGHGLIAIGIKIVEMFNDSFHLIRPELKRLGLLDNSNILLNVEYVDGITNVIDYKKEKFLMIHGLLKIISDENRETIEIDYDNETFQKLIKKLDKSFKNHGFSVYSNVPIYSWKKNEKPDLLNVLSEKYVFNGEEKTLNNWIRDIDKIYLPLINREKFSEIISGDRKEMIDDRTLNSVIVYLATISLGDEILLNLKSDFGDVSEQEGIVIRDKGISDKPFKITGSFILRGFSTKFKK